MLHNGKTARPGKAGGSTLMISLMVIVIFGAFAYALNKMKTDTADTFNNSLMYEKAAQAAYSVLEMATYEGRWLRQGYNQICHGRYYSGCART